MPALELGDLLGVEKHMDANIPVLARCVRGGDAILSAVPSCTLMFEQALPLMFPDQAEVQRVKAVMFNPFESLTARQKDGLLKTDFKRGLGRISDPITCDDRVQKVGRKPEEMFRLIDQSVTVTLNTVERGAGHAGTCGVKTATSPVAMKIGRPVFKLMAKETPNHVASDCPMAGHQIAQGLGQAGTPAKSLFHPRTLVRYACGLE